MIENPKPKSKNVLFYYIKEWLYNKIVVFGEDESTNPIRVPVSRSYRNKLNLNAIHKK